MASARKITYGGPGLLNQSSGISLSLFTLDQTTDASEIIFQVEEAATIARVGIYIGVITGAQPTYTLSLQGVTTAGVPDGTILGGGTPASVTVTPSVGSSFQWFTLDNAIALTRGQKCALVFKYAAGTIGASNKVSVGVIDPAIATSNPYWIQNEAGTRTFFSTSLPVFGYATASNAANYGFPLNSTSQIVFHSGSNPDEYAVKFTLPTSFCATYKLQGFRWLTAPNALNTDTSIINLYSGTDTTLANSTGAVTETTIQQSATVVHNELISGSMRVHEYWFTGTPVTLYAGATYRVGIQPQVGSNGLYLNRLIQAAATDWQGYPGGQDIGFSSRVNVGNWTDDSLSRMIAELVLQDLTAPSGGGLLVNPGLAGGFHG